MRRNIELMNSDAQMYKNDDWLLDKKSRVNKKTNNSNEITSKEVMPVRLSYQEIVFDVYLCLFMYYKYYVIYFKESVSTTINSYLYFM